MIFQQSRPHSYDKSATRFTGSEILPSVCQTRVDKEFEIRVRQNTISSLLQSEQILQAGEKKRLTSLRQAESIDSILQIEWILK